MTNFKIGSYEITSLNAFTMLNNAGAKSDAVLKNFDKNGDKKISEDELAEFVLDEEEAEQYAEKSDEEKILSQLKSVDLQINAYEEQLNAAYSNLATAKDIDETESIMSDISSLQSKIDGEQKKIYDLLVAQEELEAQAAANGQVSSVGATNSVSSVNSNSPTVTNVPITNVGSTKLGNAVVSIAQSFEGKLKESDNSYLKVTGGRHEAWCADFVTYVVKQACAQTGTSLNGFGSASVSTLRTWGEKNNCYHSTDGMSASEKAKWIANNVQPGDVMIQKNGCSHTGIVIKVYPDGSYDTIEGNTSDQCKKRHYSATDSKLSGFIDIT